MKYYLYHRVPKNMQGTILYPLHILKDTHPDVYVKAASKYVGRKEIMQHRLPILDCLWNDALHFFAVHPSHIKETLHECGDTKEFKLTFFEVDPYLLDPKNTS